MKCTIKGCGKNARYKTGICITHYQRMWRIGSYDLPSKPEKVVTVTPLEQEREYAGMGYVLTLGVNHAMER